MRSEESEELDEGEGGESEYEAEFEDDAELDVAMNDEKPAAMDDAKPLEIVS